jgi:hypothetical protein
MATTHYERRLEQEVQTTVQGILAAPISDHLMSVRLRGVREGLMLAQKLFKEVAQANTDPDDL